MVGSTLKLRNAQAATVVIAVLAAAAVWWLWARSAPTRSELEPLVIAYTRAMAMAPLLVAEANGLFAEEGLDVELVEFSSGRDSWNAVLNGEAHIATPYDGPVVLALATKQPIRILAMLADVRNNTALVARRDRGIDRPADLVGKTVGVIPGSSSEYLLVLLLADAGLSVDQVSVVELSPNDTAAALIEGRVDAVVTWRPHFPLAVERLGTDAVTVLTSPTFTEHVFLATSESVLGARAEAIDAALRAIYRAATQIYADPREGYERAAAPLRDSFPEDVLELSWSNLRVDLSLTNAGLEALSLQTRWFAEATGMGPVDDDLTPYLEAELLRSVDPTLVTIQPRSVSPP